MKRDPLPAEFAAFVKRLALDPTNRGPRHIWHFLILRWGFWTDGVEANSLPGYATCPKPAIGRHLPAGWSYRKIRNLCNEATAAAAVVHQGRKAIANQPVVTTSH